MGGIAADFQALLAREFNGFRRPITKDKAEIEGNQAFFQPGEIRYLTVSEPLVGLRGEVEAIHHPGVVFLEFQEAHPGLVGLQRQGFLFGLVVDETPTPGEVGEGTPLSGDKR